MAIVAATKGRTVIECREALAAGVAALGENRVQEALPKMDALPDAEWHLLGHLQSNKVRAAGPFALIQSLDSVRLAETLARRGGASVLLQVNASEEPQKYGVPPSAAVQVAAEVAGLLDLRGLMTIGPLNGDPRPAFDLLKRLRDEAQQRLGRSLPVLSMGMSEDYEAAVAAGSSMVRLGRVLFEPALPRNG